MSVAQHLTDVPRGLTTLADQLESQGRVQVANAPEGCDALLIGRLLESWAQAGRTPALLHIARDDARMAQLAEHLAFFAPDVTVLQFPAWDCLPYDRVSPHRDVVAARIDTLTRLMTEPLPPAGRVVITTVNAVMQKMPAKTVFADRTLSASPGEALAPDRLTAFLVDNGYVRVETVSEPGEYAVRGGLLDVFPPGADQPLRLDFFGDELESIRTFDPLNQRSTGSRDAFSLKPVSEIILDETSIARFRSGYRAAFGAMRGGDPLYEAVTAGRVHPGMEHWLPLFYDQLWSLFDYLPDTAVSLDYQAEEVRDTRLETIDDFFQARESLQTTTDTGGQSYKPLLPERLYLNAADWQAMLDGRPTVQFSPFEAPDHAPDGLSAEARRAHDFSEARAAAEEGALFEAVSAFIRGEQGQGRRVLVTGFSDGSRDRLAHLIQEQGVAEQQAVAAWPAMAEIPPAALGLATLGLERGFGVDDVTLISEQDILGQRMARPQGPRKRRAENFLTEVSALHDGDLVVHVDHGIGRYEGLETLTVGGAPHDCLKVIYHGGDRLFVPVENIEVLSRYGSEDSDAELDRLGLGNWQARKAKVKERLKFMADELIKVAAARTLKQGEAMLPPEGVFDEFCARFPYAETDDQNRAIAETLNDLSAGTPMDRLVCGDVGFGKTEVALRAAFVAAMTGRQVAVVVPTTLLSRQHHQTFRERFAGLPLRIGQLSRLVSAKDAAAVKAGLADGTVDIVIGTHALLSKSITFRDLGLLIVDEEQHFGVKQKERLKQLREDIHVLTLTATPIPRTLQLALTGVKELSMIASPPVDRLAVRTFVLPYDPVIVREAILREHHRGGQTFYVAPRIEDLPGLAERLGKLVPEVKLGVAHGRLPAAELEAVMTDFVDHRFDVLLSTNIIESGLDIPSANTLIIHRADMFGLAQLYQIRGRIGRAKLRGYAYLTLPPGRLLSTAAEKRLQVMQTLDTLGAGFTLASHDLDIRGAGNLLGEEQSGHIREVGIELYQQMLEEAVAAARAGGAVKAEEAADWTPQISIGTSVLIPERYVADLNVRLGLYRRLATLVDRSEIEAFAAELIDRFGPIPEEVENLLQIIAIKRLCRDAGVEKVEAGPKGAVVSFREDQIANPEGLIRFIQSQPGSVKLRPDHKLVYRRQWDDAKARVGGVRRLMDELAKAAA